MKNEEGVEQDANRYGEELLCANWNPVVALLHASIGKPAVESRTAAPEWREDDVDAFLGRVYQAGN